MKEIFGGDTQKGIENSQFEQTVIAVSNPRERRYDDRYLQDGTYQYYGQAAQQDDDPWHGNNNRKLRDHALNGRSLLLFIRDDNGIRFDGEWVYDRHHEVQVNFEERQRPHVVFILVRADALQQEQLQNQIDEFLNEDVAAIRQRAIDAGNPDPNVRARAGNAYQRAAAVSAHVLNRAGHRCECCPEEAPFNRRNGRPYLECHHIDRRADNGADDIYSVIALHPTCHRFVHHALEGPAKNEEMRAILARIEPRPPF
ncbi:HNH endonuclease [Rhizobium leguminosarum]